ncbi:MAG: 50S ribosomal protein L30e [Candidatus Hodarchaeales archaeon]|jgi:large subunit ribosomal protein L30e
MKPDLERAINMAMSTGRVKMGYQNVLASVLNGKMKVTIISNNLPADAKEELKRNCAISNIPIISFEKSGRELGAVCGRPHKVSALAIVDPGNSKILDYIE